MYRLEADGTTVLDSLDAGPLAAMMAGGPDGAVSMASQVDESSQGDLKEPVGY